MKKIKDNEFNEHYQWGWCSLCGSTIICLKCGNSTCNAMYGKVDGKTCNMCEQAYDYTRKKYNKPLKYKLYDYLDIRYYWLYGFFNKRRVKVANTLYNFRKRIDK